jgi:hypothetical protein
MRIQNYSETMDLTDFFGPRWNQEQDQHKNKRLHNKKYTHSKDRTLYLRR